MRSHFNTSCKFSFSTNLLCIPYRLGYIKGLSKPFDCKFSQIGDKMVPPVTVWNWFVEVWIVFWHWLGTVHRWWFVPSVALLFVAGTLFLMGFLTCVFRRDVKWYHKLYQAPFAGTLCVVAGWFGSLAIPFAYGGSLWLVAVFYAEFFALLYWPIWALFN